MLVLRAGKWKKKGVRDRTLGLIHFGLVRKEKPKRAQEKGEDRRKGG
jgi:hypothetical protein